MNLRVRPYNLFLLMAVAVLVAGYIVLGNSTVDIHLHDTYIVFPAEYWTWVPAVILFLFWLIYLATRKLLYSPKLIWVHIISTILSGIFMVALPFLLMKSFQYPMPRRYYDYGSFSPSLSLGVIGMLWTTVLLFAAGMAVYLINLGMGIFKRIK